MTKALEANNDNEYLEFTIMSLDMTLVVNSDALMELPRGYFMRGNRERIYIQHIDLSPQMRIELKDYWRGVGTQLKESDLSEVVVVRYSLRLEGIFPHELEEAMRVRAKISGKDIFPALMAVCRKVLDENLPPDPLNERELAIRALPKDSYLIARVSALLIAEDLDSVSWESASQVHLLHMSDEQKPKSKLKYRLESFYDFIKIPVPEGIGYTRCEVPGVVVYIDKGFSNRGKYDIFRQYIAEYAKYETCHAMLLEIILLTGSLKWLGRKASSILKTINTPDSLTNLEEILVTLSEVSFLQAMHLQINEHVQYRSQDRVFPNTPRTIFEHDSSFPHIDRKEVSYKSLHGLLQTTDTQLKNLEHDLQTRLRVKHIAVQEERVKLDKKREQQEEKRLRVEASRERTLTIALALFVVFEVLASYYSWYLSSSATLEGHIGWLLIIASALILFCVFYYHYRFDSSPPKGSDET